MIARRVLMFFLLTAAAAAQSTGSIVAGKVSNSEDGTPIRAAVVKLRSTSDTYIADTDSDGRFRIDGVTPGTYAASAEKTGLASPGAARKREQRITVNVGQSVADLGLTLTPLGVITGRTVDPDGDPIAQARVEAMQYSYADGRKTLVTKVATTSDDRGEYRIYHLPQGRYYVRAAGPFNQLSLSHGTGAVAPVQSLVPTASISAEATALEVKPGSEVHADIRLHPEKMYAVRGKMAGGPEMSHPEGFHPRLQRRSNDPGGKSGLSLQFNTDTFAFSNVTPGSYVLDAMMIDPDNKDRRTYARQYVEVVDGDVNGVNLTFAPAMQIAGTVRGGAVGARVELEEDPTGLIAIPLAEVAGDGSFTLRNVVQDIYRLRIAVPEGAYLKSIRMGDRELPDQHVDFTRGAASLSVVLGKDGGVLDGIVLNARGDPAADATVALIPDSDWPDRLKLASGNAIGNFSFRDIAPGSYHLFAWEDVEPGAAQDPEFRKPYEGSAVAVQVEPNSRATVSVTAK